MGYFRQHHERGRNERAEAWRRQLWERCGVDADAADLKRARREGINPAAFTRRLEEGTRA